MYQQLTNRDLLKVVNNLPMHIVEILTTEKVFLAGGSLLSLVKGIEVNDFDLFGSNKEDLQRIYRDMHDRFDSSKLMETKNAATIIIPDEKPVQFIYRWTFDSAIDCMLSFDFAICRVAIWYEDGIFKSAVDDRFYTDLTLNRLTYTSPVRDEDSAGSLLRAFKYAQKGYKVPKETVMAVVARFLSGLDEEMENRWGDMSEDDLRDFLMQEVTEQFTFSRGNY